MLDAEILNTVMAVQQYQTHWTSRPAVPGNHALLLSGMQSRLCIMQENIEQRQDRFHLKRSQQYERSGRKDACGSHRHFPLSCPLAPIIKYFIRNTGTQNTLPKLYPWARSFVRSASLVDSRHMRRVGRTVMCACTYICPARDTAASDSVRFVRVRL